MTPLWPCIGLLVLVFCACQPAVSGSEDSASNHSATPHAGRKRAPIESISFEDFFALHESGSLLLLDARPIYYYNEGHIPGAINFHANQYLELIELKRPAIEQAIKAGKTVVIYCTGFGCRDARTLSRRLAFDQYPVSVFSGGWRDWKNSGLPVESASQAPPSSVTPSAP